ncbi:MAG: patatin-like phospholipase family protein [Rhodococcus sp. (in: high G+C Gram-positive bacteria)]|nr:MAG: patatin-like phospholipase family protein [Rhodococcus sp. (in: high G+C Gram-positive bacteria)]
MRAHSDGYLEPVSYRRGEEVRRPTEGVGLCLSGGGYRAMLFHVGVVWRLNEVGMLAELTRISSVSGGSLTAGALGLGWKDLEFVGGVAKRLDEALVGPVRRLARITVDASAVATGIVMPFTSVGQRVSRAYRKYLFGDATLQNLPDCPVFVITATNLQSGVLMRFTKRHLADYRVGLVRNPTIPIADVVAASSAFPPVLSPVKIDLRNAEWETTDSATLTSGEFRSRIPLGDGGIYDNLGLEPVWKRCHTVLVSDAGGALEHTPDVATDWPRHTLRVLKVVDSQVRALRKQQVIGSLLDKTREGAYFGIRSTTAHFDTPCPIPADPTVTRELADVPTRLAALDSNTQERLINWGYVACDSALRSHCAVNNPAALPYPACPIGPR